jgi:NAD+ diphosphatase
MSSQNDFNLCPVCGSRKIANVNNRKWLCEDCGFDLYNNVAAAVGVVIADRNGNVLFEKRAKDPGKGFLALPGGFVDPDESAEEAAVRECREETGAEPSSISYLCSFPNTYEYKNIVYKTCDLFFTAALPPDVTDIDALIQKLHCQESEVLGFTSVIIRSREDIEKIPLAFSSAEKTLQVWLKKLNNRSVQ